MMTQTREAYCLNLSPRYVPTWGAWEVAREILCNAFDACPDGMRVEPQGMDTLRVWTPTVPNISELFIIGEGTKAPGGETIGQFGEGLKIAALTVTRHRLGNLTLRTPDKLIDFEFRPVMGVDVLHAVITPMENSPTEGYEAVIRMPGIALAFAGKLLPERVSGPIAKVNEAEVMVYSKGVFVCCKNDMSSIWDWNLNDLTLNRDRSMVESFNLTVAVGAWLVAYATNQQLDAMILHSTKYESNQVLYWFSDLSFAKKLAKAFRRVHGDNAVIEIEIDTKAHSYAKSIGRKPVSVNKNLGARLIDGGIQTVQEVLPKNSDLESVSIDPYRKALETLRSLDAMITAPPLKVCIFANREDHLKGRADFDDHTVWLSEGLFSPGNELELIRTYLHEVGHIMSQKQDETREFENALDGIAGRLAQHILARRVVA